MPVREDFANVGNRFLDATVASSSSSQSMLGLAPTLPWIRSKQAGRQIQNSIEQIRNLYRANPKQHLIKSKISVGQIPKLLWTNPKWKRKKSAPPLAGEIPDWQKRVFPPAGCLLVCVCCHFPTISSTMKPWLVSHVIKTCLPRSTCVANWTMTHNIPRTNSIQIFLGEKRTTWSYLAMMMSIIVMMNTMKDTIVSVIMIMRIMMIMMIITIIIDDDVESKHEDVDGMHWARLCIHWNLWYGPLLLFICINSSSS